MSSEFWVLGSGLAFFSSLYFLIPRLGSGRSSCVVDQSFIICNMLIRSCYVPFALFSSSILFCDVPCHVPFSSFILLCSHFDSHGVSLLPHHHHRSHFQHLYVQLNSGMIWDPVSDIANLDDTRSGMHVYGPLCRFRGQGTCVLTGESRVSLGRVFCFGRFFLGARRIHIPHVYQRGDHLDPTISIYCHYRG